MDSRKLQWLNIRNELKEKLLLLLLLRNVIVVVVFTRVVKHLEICVKLLFNSGLSSVQVSIKDDLLGDIQ